MPLGWWFLTDATILGLKAEALSNGFALMNSSKELKYLTNIGVPVGHHRYLGIRALIDLKRLMAQFQIMWATSVSLKVHAMEPNDKMCTIH